MGKELGDEVVVDKGEQNRLNRVEYYVFGLENFLNQKLVSLSSFHLLLSDQSVNIRNVAIILA